LSESLALGLLVFDVLGPVVNICFLSGIINNALCYPALNKGVYGKKVYSYKTYVL